MFKEYRESHADLSEFRIDDFCLAKNEKKTYNHNPCFDYTDEEDQFLSYALFKYGYGSWELIRNEIRNSNRFILNWVVKSRSI